MPRVIHRPFRVEFRTDGLEDAPRAYIYNLADQVTHITECKDWIQLVRVMADDWPELHLGSPDYNDEGIYEYYKDNYGSVAAGVMMEING